MISSARAAGALVCLAKDDLGAPYCEHERERHQQLCAALREHADIAIDLKDFFGSDCVNSLCLAEIGMDADLLVVNCAYGFAEEATAEAAPVSASDPVEIDDMRTLPRRKDIFRMSVVPDSIEFCVFEQIGPATNGSTINHRSD